MSETILYRENDNEPALLWVFGADGLIGCFGVGLSSVIGSGGDAEIRIESPSVAEAHGRIALVDGQYLYRDLGCEYGTRLNRKRLGAGSSDVEDTAALSSGDVLRFKPAEDSGSGCVTALFTRNLPRDTRFETIALSENTSEIRIGRSDEAGFTIRNDAVSEKHASFFRSENGWVLIDHASTNGVFLNGKRLTTPRYLSPSDTVSIAGVYFVFLGNKLLFSAPEGAAQSAPAPAASAAPALQKAAGATQNEQIRKETVTPGGERLVINIIERSVMRRFKKLTLLQDISISVAPGEMVLILGGSGAGKTTFLNAVMGYEKASGSIVYDGTDIYGEYDKMKYEIGFVPQNDLLRGTDNVYATLENAARMKLPAHMNDEARKARVEEMLEEFGLSRERDSLVSKLSGGQRKRLSIAVEFISRPKLFFLDEPDSGIDDVMGRGLMENLRRIADSGTIVMIITHSPERAADLFDKVIVLAKSSVDNCGHLAFYGTPDEAFRFFDVTAFRGIVKRINRPDENGEGLSDYYIKKYKELEAGRS